MPLTPAHIGPVVLIGALAGRKLNLTVLIISAILIDLEVLYLGIERGMFLYHGVLHTFVGATYFGLVFGTIFFFLLQITWKGRDFRYGQNKTYLKLKLFRNHEWTNSYKCIVMSAILGSYSHIALDWFLYDDIRISVISHVNIYHDIAGQLFVTTLFAVYLFCALTFIMGLVIYTLRGIFKKNKWYKTDNISSIRLYDKDLWTLMGIFSTPFAVSGFVIYTTAIFALFYDPGNALSIPGHLHILATLPIILMIIGFYKGLKKVNWKLFE